MLQGPTPILHETHQRSSLDANHPTITTRWITPTGRAAPLERFPDHLDVRGSCQYGTQVRAYGGVVVDQELADHASTV
jgi:hypothetical protein